MGHHEITIRGVRELVTPFESIESRPAWESEGSQVGTLNLGDPKSGRAHRSSMQIN